MVEQRGNQHHKAALGNLNGALIDQGGHGQGGILGQIVAARQEVGIGHLQGGGHKTAHIDGGSRTQKNSVGIDEKYSSVGLQHSVNYGGVETGDAVEHAGELIGLEKAHGLAGTDIEAGPIDDGLG